MKNSEAPNPYEPAVQSGRIPSDRKATSIWRSAAAGAAWSVVSTFPLAGLMALVFRFPIPFAGIASGPSAVVPAMLAVVFYGVLMGGLVVVAIGGLIAGIVAHSLAPTAVAAHRLQRLLSVAVALFLLFLLATLDWYIGPW